MATLDIRQYGGGEIDQISFDDTGGDLVKMNHGLYMINAESLEEVALCNWEDFDNFIAACHKARELWGPK